MDLLENVVQEYAWGSRTFIADLLGRSSPSPKPQAELWMGAHPSAPSATTARTANIGRTGTLLDQIARGPEAELGAATVRRFGPRLPFLFKVLAADRPLSLQVHPDESRARAGFAREETAGLARSSPVRNYRDPYAKPELVCALTSFEALCGFRSLPETRKLLRALRVEGLSQLTALIEAGSNRNGLAQAFEQLMTFPEAGRAVLLEETLGACRRLQAENGPFSLECGWAVKLAEQYPGDVGAVSSLLMNLVSLRPGEALFLSPGNLHAYLSGAAIEIMGNSDNVLRGGLTAKHIDLGELLGALNTGDGPVTPLRPEVQANGEELYATPAPEFRLSRLRVGGERTSVAAMPLGPDLVLCVEGQVQLSTGRETLTLARGASAWIPASDGGWRLEGDGLAFRATVPNDSVKK